MEIERDEVEIFCLPDSAKCCADDDERSPLDICMCPEGNRVCTGDCEYYSE